MPVKADLTCEACFATPYYYCVQCQHRDVQVTVPSAVLSFWDKAAEIMGSFSTKP